MDRWNEKVAVVTGASSGIGRETAKRLVAEGVIVVGLARRKAVMEEKMKNVQGKGKFYAKECDITKEESVIETFKWVKDTLGSLNILVNNAGVMTYKSIEDSLTADLEAIIDVNVKGLLYCTKHAIKLMQETQNEAHIINLNSILGHQASFKSPIPFNVYPASKYAVTAMTESLRSELVKSKIRITSISPGLVKTEMLDKAAEVYPGYNQSRALEPADVADAIVYALAVPPRVEINELIIQAKF